jgi:hypothetical protein
MLGLIRITTYSFSTLDSPFIVHITLVRPKLECACTVRSSVRSTDAQKLEHIRQYCILTHDPLTGEDFLNFLKLHTRHDRRIYPDALYFIAVYSGLKCCPSLLDTTGVRVLPCNFRNFSLFTANCQNSPSARCVSAANRECTDVDIFRKPVTLLKQILR